MAVYNRMPLRVRVFAFFAVLMVFLSLEVVQGQAPAGCDVINILGLLTGCDSKPPVKGDSCCQGFESVETKYNPSKDCICYILKSGVLAIKQITLGSAEEAIDICVNKQITCPA